MEKIEVAMNEDQSGSVNLFIDGIKMGLIEIAVNGNLLTAIHTEVKPEGQGKGYAGKLLNGLVDYARENALKIYPSCSYVHAQFTRHPDRYQDLWAK